MKKGRLCFVMAVAIGVLILALTTSYVYKRAFRAYEDFEAIWLTHDMLTGYMASHDGDWPAAWNDLATVFTSANRGYGAEDLDWVRQRVIVDFSFDPKSYMEYPTGSGRRLEVIKLRNGRMNDEVRSANRRLQEFVLSDNAR